MALDGIEFFAILRLAMSNGQKRSAPGSGEVVRPASTREARHAVKKQATASFDSVLLGPDLRPSASAQAGAQALSPGPAAQPHPAALPVQAPEALEGDASELVPNLDELPAEIAARTLIASVESPRAQQARDQVQIAAREVAAELEDPRLIMVHEPDSKRAATFRILRHRLVEHGHPRTILVTSANPRDGKTLLAVNLALALSECGRARVLLVEANLRKPSLARMLGFRPPSCFAGQLVAHKTRPMEPWMVAQVTSPWLHVIAVDFTTFERPQVIDGPALEGGLDQLKRVQYDYLILDTPPVLGSADVNLVQDSADAVLLAAWARRTSTKDLRRAIDQLTPSKIIGVSLLDV